MPRVKGKIILLLTFFLLLTTSLGIARAVSEPVLAVDGREEPLPLTPVWTEAGLLVPLRPVLEALGVEALNWQQEENKISWVWEGKEYVLEINSIKAIAAGEEIELTQPPLIVEGHTLVPADFLEEYFQVDMNWNTQSRQFEVACRGGGREETNPAKGKRQQIVETALKYQGVPYRWGGTGPSGFDSSGFIWYVFRENGIQLPRVSFEMYKVGVPVSKEELLPGDLVFFEGYRPGPSHGTIYIGDGKFIHSPSTGGCVSICSIDDPYYWAPRYYGARRVIEEDE
ncbi:MAG TPA: cell wall lytic activity [Firmicutes bacterium]|nr:cell wall lytic activity [Bacillota bacterium]